MTQYLVKQKDKFTFYWVAHLYEWMYELLIRKLFNDIESYISSDEV